MKPYAKRIQALLPWLLAATLLVVKVPGLWSELAANRAAIVDLSVCFRGQASNGGEVVSQESWLSVAAALCKRDIPTARAAARNALSTSDERLDVLRTQFSDDADLARFAVSAYPDRPTAYYWLGDALAASGNGHSAIATYKQGLARDGTNADVWLETGDLYKSDKDLPNAATAYDHACRFVDTGSNGCQRAGDVYMQLGQYELAAARYNDSISQIGYTWIPSEEGLVNALMALGRNEEALPHLRILADHGSVQARNILKQLRELAK